MKRHHYFEVPGLTERATERHRTPCEVVLRFNLDGNPDAKPEAVTLVPAADHHDAVGQARRCHVDIRRHREFD